MGGLLRPFEPADIDTANIIKTLPVSIKFIRGLKYKERQQTSLSL